MEPYVNEISAILASLGLETEDAALVLAAAARAWLEERAAAMGQDEVDASDLRELVDALVAALERA